MGSFSASELAAALTVNCVSLIFSTGKCSGLSDSTVHSALDVTVIVSVPPSAPNTMSSEGSSVNVTADRPFWLTRMVSVTESSPSPAVTVTVTAGMSSSLSLGAAVIENVVSVSVWTEKCPDFSALTSQFLLETTLTVSVPPAASKTISSEGSSSRNAGSSGLICSSHPAITKNDRSAVNSRGR